jgi:hypothetical protein
MRGNELVDIEGEIVASTAYAIKFRAADSTVWLARSLIEINDDGTVTMPEWLAMDKELI